MGEPGRSWWGRGRGGMGCAMAIAAALGRSTPIALHSDRRTILSPHHSITPSEMTDPHPPRTHECIAHDAPDAERRRRAGGDGS